MMVDATWAQPGRVCSPTRSLSTLLSGLGRRYGIRKGHYVTCPRDGFLIVGDEIIETPIAWRSRYFEPHAFRKLFKDYFARGARWTAAPRPELRGELFNYKWTRPSKDEPLRYMITEFAPVFDAADFVRCGRDLFGIRSNVTNAAGFEWLRRHLARDGYRIHELQHQCRTAMYIDSTFVPLCPDKVLVNPEYLDPAKPPAIFKSWDILVAPRPDPAPLSAWRFRVSQCSPWISINVLMLAPKRVVVEASQKTLIAAFRDWGFQPIPCPFLNYAHADLGPRPRQLTDDDDTLQSLFGKGVRRDSLQGLGMAEGRRNPGSALVAAKWSNSNAIKHTSSAKSSPPANC